MKPQGRPHFNRYWYGYGLLLFIVLLALVRALLPTLVKDYVNRTLSSSSGYEGHVGDVHLALWRGAYELRDIEIHQLNSATREPLFQAPRMEISVLWSALIDRMVVARIRVFEPKVSFAAGHAGNAAQTGKGANWADILRKLAPFRIDRFESVDGQVHYYDFYSAPKVDVYLNQVNAVITNLTNHEDQQKRRVATLKLQALAVGQAEVRIDLQIDPFAEQPDFNLKARLTQLQVTRMRDFLHAYTLIDPKQGTLDLVAELNARNGSVKGYLKPLFHNLELLQWKHVTEQEKDPLHFLMDAVGSVINLVFQNQSKDQLATLIPVEGRFDDPDVDVFSTIGNLLKNATVKAFTPTFEHIRKDN